MHGHAVADLNVIALERVPACMREVMGVRSQNELCLHHISSTRITRPSTPASGLLPMCDRKQIRN